MLREHFPDLWNKLKNWESKSWNNFRHDYTIPQLEIRFDLEKEWEEKDLLNMTIENRKDCENFVFYDDWELRIRACDYANK